MRVKLILKEKCIAIPNPKSSINISETKRMIVCKHFSKTCYSTMPSSLIHTNRVQYTPATNTHHTYLRYVWMIFSISFSFSDRSCSPQWDTFSTARTCRIFGTEQVEREKKITTVRLLNALYHSVDMNVASRTRVRAIQYYPNMYKLCVCIRMKEIRLRVPERTDLCLMWSMLNRTITYIRSLADDLLNGGNETQKLWEKCWCVRLMNCGTEKHTFPMSFFFLFILF